MKFEQPDIHPTDSSAQKEHVEQERLLIRMREIFNSNDQVTFDLLCNEIEAFNVPPQTDTTFSLQQLKKAFTDRDLDTFVSIALKIIAKLKIQEASNPLMYENIRRERVLQTDGNVQLSELLYYNLSESTACIHIAPKGDLDMLTVTRSLRTGMRELAKHVSSNSNILKIEATSWIVSEHPLLMKHAGFTIDHTAHTDKNEPFMDDEGRVIAHAFINREAFLKKYLSQTSVHER